MEEIIRENYYRVKTEVKDIIRQEIARIEKDPQLQKLLPGKK